MTTPTASSTPIRAFQWDLARQVERLEVLQRLLPRYAEWGYQELYLHLEDAVHYPSLPGIGREDAYHYEELGELVVNAARNGIRVVPIVNLLGHTQYLIRHPHWRDLNECRDERDRPLAEGQVCPLHPRLPEVVQLLLRDVAPFCTAGLVHVGLDESFQLGRCPRCRAEVAGHGLAAHFAGHVARLHRLAGAHGLQLGLWADMLYFVPEAIPLLPAGATAYDWYYYGFPRLPRVEFFNFAEHDLATPLRRQGLRYYGCPMNGAFRFEPLPVFGDRLDNLRSWWRRCREVAADGFLVTSWEAYRLALDTTTVVDAAAAGLWLHPEQDDPVALLAAGLARRHEVANPRALARRLLAADPLAFAGYARWQINDRWDLCATRESLAPYVRERSFFRRQLRCRWPAAFAASLAFRAYLAERDVFVRTAAREVWRLRRLRRSGATGSWRSELKRLQASATAFGRTVEAGARAARAMWRLSRDPARRGQNEALVQLDRQRLAAWRTWLRGLAREPEAVFRSSPVVGAWQLLFTVLNFAPAVQKVVVEQADADGNWRQLAARHTIEFRGPAARPRAALRRPFSVPLDSATAPLRVRVDGVGEVALSEVLLTDGTCCRRRRDFRTRLVLGRPAPTVGLPDPSARGAAFPLEFEAREFPF